MSKLINLSAIACVKFYLLYAVIVDKDSNHIMDREWVLPLFCHDMLYFNFHMFFATSK
jgi:hypothetical protein